jgi:predicted CoA-binding protein
MTNQDFNSDMIKKILSLSKTIAMVGVSSVKPEISTNLKRKPSIIVMKYLQEFGYKIIPVNPNSAGKKINEETAVEKLTDINKPVDIVNVFRPSNFTPAIAEDAVKIGAKVLWLQYGIHNEEAKKISNDAGMTYIENKCIKQEYQKLLLKISPVFPVLQRT